MVYNRLIMHIQKSKKLKKPNKSKKSKKPSRGFTMIEIIVTVIVISILVPLFVVGYGNWRKSVAQSQVKSDLNGIAGAMEDARNFGNAYPADVSSLTTFSAGEGVSLSGGSQDGGKTYCVSAVYDDDPSVRYYVSSTGGSKPTVSEGVCGPINLAATVQSSSEVDLSWDSLADAESYVVQKASNATFSDASTVATPSNTSVRASGLTPLTDYYFRVKGVTPYGDSAWSATAAVTTPANVTEPSAPTITVTLDGSNVLATLTSVSCAVGTAQYRIDYKINEGSWSGYTDWSTNLTASQTASDGVKYTYRAEARCYYNETSYSTGVVGAEDDYIDPIPTPTTPTVYASTVGDTTTWSWAVATCAAGTTARYQYDYTISPDGYDSGWIAKADNSVAFPTENEGKTNQVSVQAQCYNANTSSSWGTTKYRRFYRQITFKQVSGGLNHSCGIGAVDDLAYCWGLNTSGQLGDNSTTTRYYPTPVYTSGVLSGLTIKYIAASNNFTCAIGSDNYAYCWGHGTLGELGNSSGASSIVPVQVLKTGNLNGLTISSLTVGHQGYACVVASNSKAYCWGQNGGDGLLGNNSTAQFNAPVAVNTTSGTSSLYNKSVIAITGGVFHTCALDSTGKAHCWGANDVGQLGDDSVHSGGSLVPVAVYTSGVLSGKILNKISNGYDHTCAVDTAGVAYCWGDNYHGKLGNNSTVSSDRAVLVNTSGALSGKTVLAIVAGNQVSCAKASDNNAYCWGDNDYGQIGDGTYSERLVPTAVDTDTELSGLTISSLANNLNAYTVFLIASDNHAYGWTYNNNGEIGNYDGGSTCSDYPTMVDNRSFNTGFCPY